MTYFHKIPLQMSHWKWVYGINQILRGGGYKGRRWRGRPYFKADKVTVQGEKSLSYDERYYKFVTSNDKSTTKRYPVFLHMHKERIFNICNIWTFNTCNIQPIFFHSSCRLMIEMPD